MGLWRIRIEALCVFVAFCLCACSQTKPQYISDSRAYTSFGVDSHDIDDIVAKTAESLLESNFFKNLKEPKAIMITDIDNQTDSEIDTETIRNELLLHLVDNEKLIIINAINDTKHNQALQATRSLRQNEEYNQYTTIEKGNLISPHYYLTGKISQHNKIIGDDEIKEYSFVFTLTDLKIGAVRWINAERLSKIMSAGSFVVKAEQAAESQSTLESLVETSDSNEVESNNIDLIAQDSTIESALESTQDSTQMLESNQDSALDSIESKGDSSYFDFSEFFSAERKNHFFAAFDVGIMNLSTIEFSPIKTTIDGKSYSISPDSSQRSYTFPINVRLGYLRDFDENWALGVNFLYNYTIASLDSSDLAIDTSYYYYTAGANIKASIMTQKLGGEVVAYYKSSSDTFKNAHIYLGVGFYKDIASKITINIDTNNTNRRFVRKIDAFYPIIKLGAVWYLTDLVGVSYELNYSWAVSGDNFVSTGLGWGIVGLQVKI